MKITRKHLKTIIQEFVQPPRRGGGGGDGGSGFPRRGPKFPRYNKLYDYIVLSILTDIDSRVKYLKGDRDDDPIYDNTGVIYTDKFMKNFKEFAHGPKVDGFGYLGPEPEPEWLEEAHGTIELVIDNAAEHIVFGDETLEGALEYVNSYLSNFMAGERS